MTVILVDTNVLVYAYDRGEYEKQPQAIRVLDQLQEYGNGLFSIQNLAEFFRAVTRGSEPILSIERARREIETLARSWVVLPLTTQVVIEATRGVRNYKFAYFDAQIWAMAKLNQIPIIFSEDFSAGATLEGVRFVNPFALGFRLEDWV